MSDTGDDNRLSDAEIIAALARVTSSARFRDSPQIVAFLNYVVDRSLAGKGDQIKGYTIAVEALGRDASFDPNTQSIVRTEAARLRQELARYYADGGRDDPVRIELPRGRYVPVFRRHGPLTVPPPEPEPKSGDGPAVVSDTPPTGLRLPIWASTLALVLIAVLAYALLDVLVIDGWNMRRLTAATGGQPLGTAAEHRRRDEPRIAIDVVGTIGQPRAGKVTPPLLHADLIDALSRFEDIIVLTGAPNHGDGGPTTVDPPAADYLLTPTLVYGTGAVDTVALRLTDTTSMAVIWQASFDAARADESPDAALRRLMLETTGILLQPFGIIPAAERRKLGEGRSSPYHCVLDATELARYFDKDRRERTRVCLEKAIADDPAFAYGYVLLARLYLRDYTLGFGSSDNLTRALGLARRAVELAPASARAHYTLMHVQVARGFPDIGLERGRQALALNPYDLRVLMQVGAQLVAMGQIDRGLPLLQQARRSTTSHPLPLTWALFLATYLEDDLATAATCVDQMPDNLDFNLVARALLAARTGDDAGAQAAVAALRARSPTWVGEARDRLSRVITSHEIVERLAGDLARITGSADAGRAGAGNAAH